VQGAARAQEGSGTRSSGQAAAWCVMLRLRRAAAPPPDVEVLWRRVLLVQQMRHQVGCQRLQHLIPGRRLLGLGGASLLLAASCCERLLVDPVH
jgi:hypothetical protein